MKYRVEQLVTINTGYLKGEIFKVRNTSEDSAGNIYRIIGGIDNKVRVWRYERELDAYCITPDVVSISARLSDEIRRDSVSISDGIAKQIDAEGWARVASATANTTPSLYSFDELMSKIKHGKLEIGFI